MASHIPPEALIAIEDAVRSHPNGISAPEILRFLGISVPQRTRQYRLNHFVTQKHLVMDGNGRWARYRIMPDTASDPATRDDAEAPDVLGTDRNGMVVREALSLAI